MSPAYLRTYLAAAVTRGLPQAAPASATTTSTNTGNWSGYAAPALAGSVSSVSTTFVVPAIGCRPNQPNASAAFWAGIDGWGNNTVEQDGVQMFCATGTAYYFAWFELYPSPTNISQKVVISPGDVVTASVQHKGGITYYLSITDHTTGQSDAETSLLTGAADTSAECIAEDPNIPTAPYAQYNQATFSSCTVNGTSIAAINPTVVSTTTPSNLLTAAPSPLGPNGSFTVTQLASDQSDLVPSTVAMAASPSGKGYWEVTRTGEVQSYGDADLYGSMAGQHLNQPIVGMAATPDGHGYWLVASDGGIFAFGNAGFYGSTGAIHLNQPIVGMASNPTGPGYWLVASDGGIFAFGVPFYGSMGGTSLNRPVVGMAADPATGGYWLVASDGGIFSFDAPFYGSTGAIHLNKPIVAMTASPAGTGYDFVASDGGIFSYNMPFYGSLGALPHLQAPITAMAASSTAPGYWLTDSQGTAYRFGTPVVRS